jgi:hypothetical protein
MLPRFCDRAESLSRNDRCWQLCAHVQRALSKNSVVPKLGGEIYGKVCCFS